MTERHFFTDTTTASLSYVGDESTFRDAVNGDFDSSQADTVILDSPWVEFFGTDEFVQFNATVARPIIQPYMYDGEMREFRKPESELRQAQAQLESAPWTMGHPDGKTVTNTDQIRGFWSDPYWDDGQQVTLSIPANDTEAVRFAVTNDEVSVGFSGTLDWTDENDDVGYDASQRNIVYDHVASVANGRCPPEKGCGLHVEGIVTDGADDDLSDHGHVVDAVQTKMTEEQNKGDDEMDPKFSEGDWVRWDWSGGTAEGVVRTVSTSETLSSSGASRDPMEEGKPAYKIESWVNGELDSMVVRYEGERNLREASPPDEFTDATHDWVTWDNGSAHGKVVDTVEEGCTTRGKGDQEVCADPDDPVAIVEVYDDETGESKDIEVRHKMSTLNEWTAMANDSCGCLTPTTTADLYRECSHGPCRCGLHVAGDAEINGESVDLTPPDSAQSAAELFVEASEMGLVPDSCGTGVGMESAEMIASGEVTAKRVEQDIAPYVTSHEGDASTDQHPSDWPMPDPSEYDSRSEMPDTPWTDCGDAQLAAWGWLSIIDWAQSTADEIKRAMGEQPVYNDATISIPNYTSGDLVRHRYIDDLRGYVAHNPMDRPYVMVDPIVDGSVNNHTMTFGTADVELISKSDGPNQMRDDAQSVVSDEASVHSNVRSANDAQFGDATTVMDTITYEGTMGGDLDESEIPNDDYQGHYVFDAETKSESSFPLVDADGNLRRENIIAAASYSEDADDEAFLMDVLREANKAFADPPLDEETFEMDVALASLVRQTADEKHSSAQTFAQVISDTAN